MCMPCPTFRRTYFSGEVGGGDLGGAIGIVQNTMTADGLIIAALPPGMEKSRGIGGIITATAFGAVIPGNLPASVTAA
jgi:hypothetical protein